MKICKQSVLFFLCGFSRFYYEFSLHTNTIMSLLPSSWGNFLCLLFFLQSSCLFLILLPYTIINLSFVFSFVTNYSNLPASTSKRRWWGPHRLWRDSEHKQNTASNAYVFVCVCVRHCIIAVTAHWPTDLPDLIPIACWSV